MSYGKEKQKDICESTLPATRKAARQARKKKSRASRKERRAVRQKTIQYDGRFSDLVDDLYLDEERFDFFYTEDLEKQWIMWERRGYDNLGALWRWAPRQVKDIRIEDRLSKIKAMLPDTLGGRHAASHLEYHDDFYVEEWHTLWYYSQAKIDERKAEEDYRKAIEYAVLVKRLREVVENGLQSNFNKQIRGIIKKKIPDEFGPHRDRRGRYKIEYVDRPLLGINDVEQFIFDCVGPEYLKVRRLDPSWATAEQRINDALDRLKV